MLGEELCDIVGSAVDNDPARVAAVVLGYVGALELDCLGVVAFVIHCSSSVAVTDSKQVGRLDWGKAGEKACVISRGEKHPRLGLCAPAGRMVPACMDRNIMELYHVESSKPKGTFVIADVS
jgi:hypothetical protein